MKLVIVSCFVFCLMVCLVVVVESGLYEEIWWEINERMFMELNEILVKLVGKWEGNCKIWF